MSIWLNSVNKDKILITYYLACTLLLIIQSYHHRLFPTLHHAGSPGGLEEYHHPLDHLPTGFGLRKNKIKVCKLTRGRNRFVFFKNNIGSGDVLALSHTNQLLHQCKRSERFEIISLGNVYFHRNYDKLFQNVFCLDWISIAMSKYGQFLCSILKWVSIRVGLWWVSR